MMTHFIFILFVVLNSFTDLIYNYERKNNIFYANALINFIELLEELIYLQEKRLTNSGNELLVSRIYFRDNKTYYHLNSNFCTLPEISIILCKILFELEKDRFLILQGEVEKICNLNSRGLKNKKTGLLEYFECIFGSKVFVSEIFNIFFKINKLKKERSKLIDSIKFVEKEKDIQFKIKNKTVNILVKEIYTLKSKKIYKSHLQNYRKKVCRRTIQYNLFYSKINFIYRLASVPVLEFRYCSSGS